MEKVWLVTQELWGRRSVHSVHASEAGANAEAMALNDHAQAMDHEQSAVVEEWELNP